MHTGTYWPTHRAAATTLSSSSSSSSFYCRWFRCLSVITHWTIIECISQDVLSSMKGALAALAKGKKRLTGNTRMKYVQRILPTGRVAYINTHTHTQHSTAQAHQSIHRRAVHNSFTSWLRLAENTRTQHVQRSRDGKPTGPSKSHAISNATFSFCVLICVCCSF